jgi:SAM-dependent methyltransferase
MDPVAFDEHAERYDAWFVKNSNVLASEVLLIRRFLSDAGRILSVGCGSGLFELLLRRDHGIRIERGVEPSEAMAAIARARGMEVSIAHAEEIPFGDDSFDTVLMNGIAAYLDSLAPALGEARRVLVPGGAIVIGDVPATSSYGMLYRMAGLIGTWDDPSLRRLAPADPYPVEFVGAARWRTTGEIAEALTAAGFGDFEYAQTLTTHARFSNDAVEEPSAGFSRGGYVAVRARSLESGLKGGDAR